MRYFDYSGVWRVDVKFHGLLRRRSFLPKRALEKAFRAGVYGKPMSRGGSRYF